MVIIGSDHTGVVLKKRIEQFFEKKNIGYYDISDFENQDGDDYPDIAYLVCTEVLKNSDNLGIAICGSGIGISIACNKIKGIRAALCTDKYMASMSRKDNDANVICFGARTEYANNIVNVDEMVDTFLNTEFEKGRHERRLQKISALENMDKKGEYRYDS